jgi:hypothetical protein
MIRCTSPWKTRCGGCWQADHLDARATCFSYCRSTRRDQAKYQWLPSFSGLRHQIWKISDLPLGRHCSLRRLQEQLERHQIQLALLPVNGRDELRRSKGIPGNFTLEEAVDLCRCSGIPILIAHHFGMFGFNTLNPELIDQAAETAAPGLRILRGLTGIGYVLEETGT